MATHFHLDSAHAALFAGLLAAGCGGGMPLFHPAHALPPDKVTMGAGVSSQFVAGDASKQIDGARAAMVDGAVDSQETENYVRGALSNTLLAPGLAPWVGARAGLGYDSDAGLAYSGHAARVDGRHAFEFGDFAVSTGVGASAIFLNVSHESASDLRAADKTAVPGLDKSGVTGFGIDVPVIVGWRSDADLFQIYGGARGGYESLGGKVILRIDPDPSLQEEAPIDASRFYALAVAGVMVGIEPIAVALEIDAGYQNGRGTITRNSVRHDGKLEGLSYTPAAAAIARF